MTAEEALALVETAIDYERLNKVQEIVFCQSWEGRSYVEIAKSTGYEADYIKDVGAKLWKLLSKAFGEKVKKDNLQSVLKRYLRRHQVNLQRNQIMGVNLSGANLSGSILCFANLNGADSGQADLWKTITPDKQTELGEEIIFDEEVHNQGIQSNLEDKLYDWNGLRFSSEEEMKIAEALESARVPFFYNFKGQLTTSGGRKNQKADFLIIYEGKLGILQLGHQDTTKNEERDRIFQSHGICIIKDYDATRCNKEPDRVVQEFLDILSQA